MALLTAITPAATGSAWAPAAVSASDTIAAADLGTRGAYLVVINGGASPDTVTVADPTFSPVGGAGTARTISVTNGTTQAIFIPAPTVNPATGVATVTHSFITTVTCMLLRLG